LCETNLWELPPRSWPGPPDVAPDPYLLPGLTRAIVPPLGTKDLLLTNLTIAEQWLQAGDVVADELVVIGYSMSDGDRAARQIIAGRFRSSNIVIVNPDPRVTEACTQLIGPSSQVSTKFTGDMNCIERYVASLQA